MTATPARVQADAGARLVLTRRGAEIATALQTLGLELLRRRAGGYVPLPSDVRAVLEATRRAAGFADETTSGTSGTDVPLSISVGPRQLDTRTAAEVTGMSTQAVRKACATGRLTAVRVSGVWVIDADSVSRYALEREATPDDE